MQLVCAQPVLAEHPHPLLCDRWQALGSEGQLPAIDAQVQEQQAQVLGEGGAEVVPPLAAVYQPHFLRDKENG